MGNMLTPEQSPTRIAVPLYLWPGYGSLPCAWERLLASPAANPVVVVNPDSGPGREAVTLFSVAVAKCQSVGIKVLGYVRTEYAKRDLSLVVADLELYSRWYNVDGFFIDEMYHWGEPLLALTSVLRCAHNHDHLLLVADESQLAYYSSVKAAAELSHKQPLLVLNPGCPTFPEAYLALADIFVTYESDADNYTSYVPASFMVKYPSSKFWHIIYSVDLASSSKTLQLFKQQNASWLYMTDLDLTNPYKDLPGNKIWQLQLQIADA
ncbi:hypothetical protein ABBQ38_012753 [Trebouxia sp. C0009 RCD-2024]